MTAFSLRTKLTQFRMVSTLSPRLVSQEQLHTFSLVQPILTPEQNYSVLQFTLMREQITLIPAGHRQLLAPSRSVLQTSCGRSSLVQAHILPVPASRSLVAQFPTLVFYHSRHHCPVLHHPLQPT